MPPSSTSPGAALRPEHTRPVELGAVAAQVAGRTDAGPGAAAQVSVTGMTLRAQDVRPGDLFAAVPGTRVHGAAFVADAVRAGARAVLTDSPGLAAVRAGSGETASVPVLVVPEVRAVLGGAAALVYGDPSRRLKVLGVTGTSGKTTTCYLLEAALAGAGAVPGLIGTVQTRIGGGAVASSLTTPEAPDLQALFAAMLEQGVDTVAMEVSSHALALGRVAGTAFTVGAFTNLSQDHLDFHADMEDYFAAKSKLFDGRAAAHVIDVDDAWGSRLAATHPGAVTVSATDRGDTGWAVLRVSPAAAGRPVALTLRAPGGRTVRTDLALPGAFNIANAVVALACADAAGFDLGAAAAALGRVVVPGRMQRVDEGQPFLAVVDYAHKPAALAAVLDAVRQDLSGRLIVVVGAGGDRDHGKRTLMGRAAAERADLVIVTDDNPRSEAPEVIRAQVLDGTRGVPGAEVREIGDRRTAIVEAVAAARAGDAVVVAGKGHEQGQEVAGVTHPFSDEAEVRAALRRAAARS